MIRRGALILSLLFATTTSAPSRAEVKDVAPQGFFLQQAYEVKATPAALYAVLVKPAGWWSADHSYSHNAANFTLDPRPGGCFCEALPGGGVEHGLVVYADPGKALRLKGGLGPLQAEAVDASLTFTIAPTATGSKLDVVYTVGGYLRPLPGQPADKTSAILAPVVDRVLGEQMQRLKRMTETGAP